MIKNKYRNIQTYIHTNKHAHTHVNYTYAKKQLKGIFKIIQY